MLLSRLAKTAAFLAFSVLICLSAGGREARSETYALDRGHTNITFSWDHLGLSRQSGRILDYQGTLKFDLEAPENSRLNVSMSTASLWTGVEALDRLLKSADYFDAATHPSITFRSTAVKRIGERTGEVTGNLTILGETRPVVLAVTWNFTGEHPLAAVNAAYKDKVAAGFSAVGMLQRSDWGLKRGVPLVSDEIHISIETELLKK